VDDDGFDVDFVREQYAQYWAMIRQHSSFSWQIPTAGVLAVVAFIALEPDRLREWMQMPIAPAVMFLLIGLFSFLLLIHHERNFLFVRYYGEAVESLEKRFGLEMCVHHSQITPTLRGWRSISSVTCLSVFLLVLTVGSWGISAYFFASVF